MLSFEFPIVTDRLLLRPFAVEDVDDVWAYQRLPAVARHMLWEVRDRREVTAAVHQMVKEDRIVSAGDCLSLAVVWPVEGRVIGQVELVWVSERDRQGEIGYVFNPEYHGKGLATEAARQMLRVGFEELGLHRIVGRCSAQNSTSAALMARLGMRREAHLVQNCLVKGSWRSELVYAMLDREWKS